MNLEVQKRNNLVVLLLSLVFVVVASAVLALVKLKWWYYPLGAVLGLITHFLMVLQNQRFYRIQGNKYEKVTYSPKKDSFLWYGLRILVIALYLVGIVFLSKLWSNPYALQIVLITLGGYMTIKIIFIIVLLVFKEGR